MTPQEYRDATLAISRVHNDPLNEQGATAALYALGLAGEAGEVVDEIKKVLFHGKTLDIVAIVKELGDVLWYVDRLLMWMDTTMEDALAANINKLSARYPNGWDAADKHHSWTAEAQA